MPLPPKPPSKRQGHGKRDVGVLTLVGTSKDGLPTIRPAPDGLLVAQQRSWEAFWRSPVASMVVEADLPALERLWRLRDEHARCFKMAKDERMSTGSTGQLVLNPLYKHMTTLETSISGLEKVFGLNPKSRLDLGVVLGSAAKSLADLNAAAAESDAGESDEELFGDLGLVIDTTSEEGPA